MLLTVPNAGLDALMASPELLKGAWPNAYPDAMMLIHVLRIASPSLADVLMVGLISLLTPAAARTSTAIVALAYKTAVLTAVARQRDGYEVPAPHTRPNDVTHLEVADLTVAGTSRLGLTG